MAADTRFTDAMRSLHPLAWRRLIQGMFRSGPADGDQTAPNEPPPSMATALAQQAPDLTWRDAQGSAEGWLRVLSAECLIGLVQGDKALKTMWVQSRLAAGVWQRDLLPAVHRYAELVQLMPASEAHHHAHVGGLLAHTIEVVMAAMTWRNGHLLPEGAAVEQMDAQRDEWTYVVFYAALLHDVAKILSDLRVVWRSPASPEPVRWLPISGTLAQVSASLARAEYQVSFTPKALRDYQTHDRLAIVLLQSVAPPTALAFLSRQPAALEALSAYLSGSDRSSLIAQIVQRADQASTQRALLQGSRARFVTATSQPLIDLLMAALRTLLKTGALPLNRSGAAGWVFDGSLWLVAKRLADTVRTHLKAQAPDEAVPGESKNDRLFDTWQDHGCITLNPATGQAIWHVTIVGELGQGGGQASYRHDLAMLRFPLEQLYGDPQHHPEPMAGRVEVRAGRSKLPQASEAPQGDAELPAIPTGSFEFEPLEAETGAASTQVSESSAGDRGAVPNLAPPLPHLPSAVPKQRPAAAPKLRAPAFNKPKAAPNPQAHQPQPALPSLPSLGEPTEKADEPDLQPAKIPPSQDNRSAATAVEGADEWLEPVAAPQTCRQSTPRQDAADHAMGKPANAAAGRLPLLAHGDRQIRALTPPPVVLTPYLPELPALPHATAAAEVSALALEFIRWLQTGLAERRLKFNETSALVHFVPEGLALVSPLVFKTYAAEAKLADATQGMQVQRAVLKAGWHLVGPGKVNIISYQVLGRGGAAVSRLSAVVLKEPGRWVTPVPVSNPVLRMVAS